MTRTCPGDDDRDEEDGCWMTGKEEKGVTFYHEDQDCSSPELSTLSLQIAPGLVFFRDADV